MFSKLKFTKRIIKLLLLFWKHIFHVVNEFSLRYWGMKDQSKRSVQACQQSHHSYLSQSSLDQTLSYDSNISSHQPVWERPSTEAQNNLLRSRITNPKLLDNHWKKTYTYVKKLYLMEQNFSQSEDRDSEIDCETMKMVCAVLVCIQLKFYRKK